MKTWGEEEMEKGRGSKGEREREGEKEEEWGRKERGVRE